jgi:hypothetical protein
MLSSFSENSLIEQPSIELLAETFWAFEQQHLFFLPICGAWCRPAVPAGGIA